MQYFNIQMASQLSGVATATIRAWEKRYQAVSPQRAENRHRLYSEEDIEKLSLLAKLTDFGQNIGKIARLDIEELKKVYTVLMRRPYRKEEVISFSKEKLNYHKSLSNLSLAISSLKMDVLTHELKKIRLALDPREVALNIIPSLHKIIETKVRNNELNLGQQMVLFSTIYQQFSVYIANFEFPSERPPLILASPPKQVFQLNILGAALLCAHHNKNFILLIESPPKALAEIVNTFNAKTVLIEASDYEIDAERNLDHYLDEMLRSLSGPTQIIIYGTDHLQQSITRKNYISVRSLQNIDEFILTNQL